MDRTAWWATAHRVVELNATEATEHTHSCFFLGLPLFTDLPEMPYAAQLSRVARLEALWFASTVLSQCLRMHFAMAVIY